MKDSFVIECKMMCTLRLGSHTLMKYHDCFAFSMLRHLWKTKNQIGFHWHMIPINGRYVFLNHVSNVFVF